MRILLSAAVLAAAPPAAVPARAAVLFEDLTLDPIKASLVTNEYAYWNPGLGVESPDWEMTSGSLFADGWTGVPDDCAPDLLSAACTNSAVFRLNTRRFDFGSVRVDMLLRANAWAATAKTPAVDWDGVHLWLRYRSEESLYYASVARRDGAVVVKKKCPGGPSNGGTYYTLASTKGYPVPLGEWRAVGAAVDTVAGGAVAIDVFRDGARVLTATDGGVGCAPIAEAGAVGIRGDNLDFNFRGFTVSELYPAAAPAQGDPAQGGPAQPPAPVPAPAPTAPPAPPPSAPPPPPAPEPAPPAPAPAPAPPPEPAGASGAPGTGAARTSTRRARLSLRSVTRRFRRTLRVRLRASGVRKVRFRIGRRSVRVDRRSPFTLRYKPRRGRLRPGLHRVGATGYDARGRRVASGAVRVRYLGR